MTELSPQAQAVRHVAICAGPELEGRIAAALRRAAGYLFPNDTAKQCYDRLLAIAAELEGST